MKLAWGRTAALIVATTVVFGTGACGAKTGSGASATGATSAAAAPTSSKAPEPKEVLLASLAQYTKGVYAVTFSGRGSSGQGSVDATKKQAYLKIVSTSGEASITLEVLTVDPEIFLKANVGELAKMPGMSQLNGKTWMRIDQSKLKDPKSLGIESSGEDDQLDIKAMLESAQSVQPAGDHKYSGTLDLAKGASALMTDDAVTKALGPLAATVPFTATLDAAGQLTELVIDVPAAGKTKPHQIKVTLSEYGTATVPAKPTGKAVIAAPASVYEIFNNQ